MAQRFELPLSPDYVKNWGVKEALREIFQNAMDQEKANPRNKMGYVYSDGVLRITSQQSSLEKSSLLLGQTTKLNDADMIGHFGEGYKLALLVLTRMGKKVVVQNYAKREIWTAKIINSKRYDAQLLVIDIDKKIFTEIPDADLTFEIQGISEEEWGGYKQNNLKLIDNGWLSETRWGNILRDEQFKGKVYVGGLFIAEVEDINFGYDIAPKHLQVDRDRKMVSSFDLCYITSQMWLTQPEEEVITLLKNDYKELEYCGNHVWGDHKQIAMAVASFTEEHGRSAYPVQGQQQVEEIKKKFPAVKTVVVGRSYGSVLQQSPDIQKRRTGGKYIRDLVQPEKALKDFQRKYSKKMGVAMGKDFAALIKDSKIWINSI